MSGTVVRANPQNNLNEVKSYDLHFIYEKTEAQREERNKEENTNYVYKAS